MLKQTPLKPNNLCVPRDSIAHDDELKKYQYLAVTAIVKVI